MAKYIPQYIIVHHSAAEEPTPQFAAINEWHRARGFAQSELGFFVGYHRVIERDGTVVKAREDDERDCDALGHNYDSLSVCLAGNFSKTDPTPAQVDALGALLNEWCSKYNISPLQIHPHRHFSNTSCPGSRLENTWPQLVLYAYLYAPKKKAR